MWFALKKVILLTKNSNPSSTWRRWLFLFALMIIAFLTGRLGKYYYQQNPERFHQIFERFYPVPLEKESTPNSSPRTLFILLESGSASQKILQQKTQLGHLLEALNILKAYPDSFQIALWLYQEPHAIKAPPTIVAPLVPKSSAEKLVSTLKEQQKNWPTSPSHSLKNILTFFQQEPPNPLPDQLLLLTYGLSPGEETLPFEGIDFQNRFPHTPISVLKLGEKKQDEDFLLFQFANETNGNFQRASTPEEFQELFRHWIQRFFESAQK